MSRDNATDPITLSAHAVTLRAQMRASDDQPFVLNWRDMRPHSREKEM
jgi:hypothetical protein